MAISANYLAQRYWIVLGFLTVAASTCFGATPNEDTIALRFRVFRIGKGDWNDIRVTLKEDVSQPVVFRKNRRSGPIDYRGARSLVFFRQRPQLPKVGGLSQASHHVLSRVSITLKIRDALIFFVAAPNEARWLVYPTDDSLECFPAGSLRIGNFSGFDLIGKIGDKTARFPQGISPAYPHQRNGDTGIPVMFVLYTAEGPKSVFQKKLQYTARQRVLLLFEPPRHPDSSRLVVKRVVQLIPATPEEPFVSKNQDLHYIKKGPTRHN